MLTLVDVNLLGFVVQKSNMVVGGWVFGWWCKLVIGHNSNSTLGEVEWTWSGDGVEMELGVELELGNFQDQVSST